MQTLLTDNLCIITQILCLLFRIARSADGQIKQTEYAGAEYPLKTHTPAGQHIACDLSGFIGGCPQRHIHRFLIQLRPKLCTIAAGIDMRHIGAQCIINYNPARVAERYPGFFRNFRIGADPGCKQDQIGRYLFFAGIGHGFCNGLYFRIFTQVHPAGSQ
jgi:hypothetical protein